MPIFEYQCLRCGHKFETLVLGSGNGKDDEVICPSCGNNRCNRLVSLCFSSSRGFSTSGLSSQCGTSKSGIG